MPSALIVPRSPPLNNGRCSPLPACNIPPESPHQYTYGRSSALTRQEGWGGGGAAGISRVSKGGTRSPPSCANLIALTGSGRWCAPEVPPIFTSPSRLRVRIVIPLFRSLQSGNTAGQSFLEPQVPSRIPMQPKTQNGIPGSVGSMQCHAHDAIRPREILVVPLHRFFRLCVLL